MLNRLAHIPFIVCSCNPFVTQAGRMNHAKADRDNGKNSLNLQDMYNDKNRELSAPGFDMDSMLLHSCLCLFQKTRQRLVLLLILDRSLSTRGNTETLIQCFVDLRHFGGMLGRGLNDAAVGLLI